MKFERWSFALVGTLLGLTTANAADMPVKAQPVAPPPAMTWTGFYIGLNGGFGGNKFEYPISASAGGISATANADITSSGFFGGGQVGYNWQFSPSWVAGIEADIDASSIKGEVNVSAAALGVGISASAGSKVDYFGTVRGRLGYLVTPTMLLYGTGGWAFGKTTASYSVNLGGLLTSSGSVSNNRSGWAAGGGVEYAINRWLSFKTEYMYYDLGTENLINTTLLGAAITVDEKATFHTIKAGLNYRF
jgi:outer membrane immunogenic protein